MTAPIDEVRQKLLDEAFQMPSVQTMVSRKSSITNAFVNSVIPVFEPTTEEIEEALAILGMDPEHMECIYCGAKSTEWDHLRPLVDKRRPTGYVSEIGNLVPACGKCNQSKGNKPWRTWMLSSAKHSPTGKKVANVAARMCRLECYEAWRPPTRIDFAEVLGDEAWEKYWALCDEVNEDMRKAQEVANTLRARIAEHVRIASAK